MLKTRTRFESKTYNSPPVTLLPETAALNWYIATGHPDWALPILVPEKNGVVTRLKEYFRGEAEKVRDRWNPCEHYKCYFDPDDTNMILYPWSALTYSGERMWKGGGQTRNLVTTVYDYMSSFVSTEPLYVEREDGGFVPPPPGLTTLIQRSLNTMLPHVKSNLSLINSIIELKDFRSLPRTLGNISNLTDRVKAAFGLLKHWRVKKGTIRRSFSLNAGPTLGEVIKGGADLYLQSQFNIGPLLSDIGGIYTTVVRTEKVIRDLIARQGKRQKKHFRFVWQPYPEVQSYDEIIHPEDQNLYTNGGEIIGGGPIAGGLLNTKIPVSFATFHAEIEYNYNYTRLQVEHARLLGILDALGVNLNPAIIWNALPWTFVVDWVLGVSQWLDSRKVLNLRPEINITRFLWSWKYDRKLVRSFRSYQHAYYDVTAITERKLPTVYESAYRRDCKLPDLTSIISSGLSLKEISLGASLAITRGKHRYNRGR